MTPSLRVRKHHINTIKMALPDEFQINMVFQLKISQKLINLIEIKTEILILQLIKNILIVLVERNASK